MAFKKGDTVYSGRGNDMVKMIVAKRHDNQMIPVYQYSFEAPHDGFATGEQSIRATPNGRDMKMSECPKDGDDHYKHEAKVPTIFNTLASGMRKSIMMDRLETGLDVGDLFSDSDVFFRPDLKFVKWLKERANGRMIIDVGCGQGHLVNMLKQSGAKAMGIEPMFDLQGWVKWRMLRDNGKTPDINEILPRTIEQSKNLIENFGADNVMLVFARPCHSDFVRVGIRNMPKGMEALYITIPENLEVYNDLGRFKQDAVLLEHDGESEDSEIVHSIVR